MSWERQNILQYGEPQGRIIEGKCVWHLHIIYIFKKRTYIPKTDFEKLWGLGFVNIKSLKKIDNLGMYLSAYLSNMQLEGGENNNSKNKRIIKGSRLRTISKTDSVFIDFQKELRNQRYIKQQNVKQWKD